MNLPRVYALTCVTAFAWGILGAQADTQSPPIRGSLVGDTAGRDAFGAEPA
jgi:hypothetical protein